MDCCTKACAVSVQEGAVAGCGLKMLASRVKVQHGCFGCMTLGLHISLLTHSTIIRIVVSLLNFPFVRPERTSFGTQHFAIFLLRRLLKPKPNYITHILPYKLLTKPSVKYPFVSQLNTQLSLKLLKTTG